MTTDINISYAKYMNEVATTNNSLQILSPKRLSNGQRTLYSLIQSKVASNAPLTMQEIMSLYSTVGCRETRDGIPCYWASFYEDGQWKASRAPLTDEMLAARSKKWLMGNLGSLVLKGYLKVLPSIEL